MITIDPTKPVGGNFRGTLAGFVAFTATGWIAKKGLFGTIAAYLCDPNLQTALMTCEEMEWSLALFFAAGVGSAINYAVTHFSQVKKLSELYDMLPSTYAEYPNDDKPKSLGMDNGNFNKR